MRGQPSRAGSRRDVARSVRLLHAFRHEQRHPHAFDALVARDLVAHADRYLRLDGSRTVLDLGSGSGFLRAPVTERGARWIGVDIDPAAAHHRGALRADARRLPLADGSISVVLSSNLLEHVPDPSEVLDELVRVCAPGAVLLLSWTPRWSPWAGHETSPWHYLGPERAALRYERRTGHAPKNRWGRTLFGHRVASVRRLAARRGLTEVDLVARYHPWWAADVMRLGAVGEVLGWNSLLVLRRT